MHPNFGKFRSFQRGYEQGEKFYVLLEELVRKITKKLYFVSSILKKENRRFLKYVNYWIFLELRTINILDTKGFLGNLDHILVNIADKYS